MSRLYNYFVSCWKNGTVTELQLDNAVTKVLITAEEKAQILLIPR